MCLKRFHLYYEHKFLKKYVLSVHVFMTACCIRFLLKHVGFPYNFEGDFEQKYLIMQLNSVKTPILGKVYLMKALKIVTDDPLTRVESDTLEF